MASNTVNMSTYKTKLIASEYTSNGGQQNPNFFGRNSSGILMMNTKVNNNTHYKDWLIMDSYSGNDVGGAVAIGVNRQALGAYIMRSAAERSTWAESAELLGTHNAYDYLDPRYVNVTGDTMTGALNLKADLNLYTSSADSPDITWWYADKGVEQARIWMGNGSTSKWAPLYRCYNSSGTQLYSGNLVLSDGTGTSPASFRAAIETWSLVSDSYNTFMPANGTTNSWYKFGTADGYGILPALSGAAQSGHSYIGTSSWYWKCLYVDEAHTGKILINQPAAHRDNGIVGQYDYTKAAAIWSMGPSYQIKADGSGLGTLYGAAYGYGGQAYLGSNAYAGGHQLLWCENGQVMAALGQGIWTSGNVNIVSRGSNRAYVSIRSATAVPMDLYMGSNNTNYWSLSVRESSDPWCGFYWAGSSAGWALTMRTNRHVEIPVHAYVGGYNNTSYALSTNSFICNSWVRSVGATGWYNETHGGGWYMTDSTYVRVYNNKRVYNANTERFAFYTEGGFASGGQQANLLSVYYNGTWRDVMHNHQNGNISLDGAGGSLFLSYYAGNTYFGGGTYYINRTGYFNGTCAGSTYASSYLSSRATVSGSSHAVALQTYFNNNYGSIPRNCLTSYYSSAYGNGSQCFGYWLSGYNSNPYGGFFICHYNTPRYVGIQNGSYSERQIWTKGDAVTGAVWNDYAENRESDCTEPGRCVMEDGNDKLIKTTERLSHFAGIISDTWGFSQGETDKAKTPIAVAGRVLAIPFQPRENYKPGDCLCAGPNGTVDIMTREEIREFPDRIVGTVSCIPDYEEWGGGENADRQPIKVNGRIWVKVK